MPIRDFIQDEIKMLEKLGKERLEFQDNNFRKGELFAFKQCLEFLDFEEGLQARE
jgi:hypothetical protein